MSHIVDTVMLADSGPCKNVTNFGRKSTHCSDRDRFLARKTRRHQIQTRLQQGRVMTHLAMLDGIGSGSSQRIRASGTSASRADRAAGRGRLRPASTSRSARVLSPDASMAALWRQVQTVVPCKAPSRSRLHDRGGTAPHPRSQRP